MNHVMGNQVSNSVCVPPPLTAVTFTLNGRVVTVDNASPLISLNDWLRSQPGLTGTKKMCGEGGCGVCVVTAGHHHQPSYRPGNQSCNQLGIVLRCPYITHGNSILCVILMYITHGNSILCVILNNEFCCSVCVQSTQSTVGL